MSLIVNRVSEIMGIERLKVSDVVKGTGLATNTVSGLYHDKAKRIDFETLDKLCAFFGRDVGEFFQWKKD
jgi:putative transcriptional regulator